MLLESRELARLGYAGLDESPRVVPIGFVQQGIEIIVYSEPSTPKVKALRRDPRVALTIDVAGLRRDQLAAEVPRWVRSGVLILYQTGRGQTSLATFRKRGARAGRRGMAGSTGLRRPYPLFARRGFLVRAPYPSMLL
jgi:hypothetical protein